MIDHTLDTEGAGKTGWPLHPGPPRKKLRKERENLRVQAVITPAFPAQWFTAYGALSPVNLADCHRRRRNARALSA